MTNRFWVMDLCRHFPSVLSPSSSSPPPSCSLTNSLRPFSPEDDDDSFDLDEAALLREMMELPQNVGVRKVGVPCALITGWDRPKTEKVSSGGDVHVSRRATSSL